MSRRASVFARQNPGKRRVRFPDEVIFENEIKEQDGHAVMSMLRRASIDIDLNRINSAGKLKFLFDREIRLVGNLAGPSNQYDHHHHLQQFKFDKKTNLIAISCY